jgi:hypothetical protein
MTTGSGDGKTVWTVRLMGKFKKHGETLEIAASPGVSAMTIKSLIANRLRVLTGNEAVASLVGISVLTTDRGVVSDREPPPEGETLSILPPACS